MSVYADYDQEALDLQYNNRELVPEHPEILAAYAGRGEAFVREANAVFDIAFGDTAAELVDVYPGGDNSPVLIYFHGGYWYSRHKDDFQFVAADYARAGATVVVVNYALIPDVDMSELIRQCRASVAWTYKNIAAHGGDRNQLYISGHSAGGHITSMMLATDWADWGVDPAAIKGATAVSGLYDLEPIRLSFMNPTLGFTEDTVRDFSPIKLKPAVPTRLVLGVGGSETNEFQRHNAMLPNAWAGSGVDMEEIAVPGLNHFTILGDFATAGGTLFERTRTLMGLS